MSEERALNLLVWERDKVKGRLARCVKHEGCVSCPVDEGILKILTPLIDALSHIAPTTTKEGDG